MRPHPAPGARCPGGDPSRVPDVPGVDRRTPPRQVCGLVPPGMPAVWSAAVPVLTLR